MVALRFRGMRVQTMRHGVARVVRSFRGVACLPKVGESLIMFNDDIRRRFTTSRVVRVLRVEDERPIYYVETTNSLYILEKE